MNLDFGMVAKWFKKNFNPIFWFKICIEIQ